GQSNEDTFTVWATVLSLPVKDELTLLRRLLEMNWTSTLEARFGILDNQIVAITQRSVADLSAGEISRAITIVATLADEQDDLLKAEFGL
ncbi:MAG: YbjN domain-containing protein, partial [Synechococcales cyanobacterium]